MKNKIGDGRRRACRNACIGAKFIAGKQDIAQHRKQVLVNTLDHFIVDKGTCRRTTDIEFDAAFALHNINIKARIALQHHLAIIEMIATI